MMIFCVITFEENSVIFRYLSNGLQLPPIGGFSSSINAIYVDANSPEYGVIIKRAEHYSFPQQQVLATRRVFVSEEDLRNVEFFSMVPEAMIPRLELGSNDDIAFLAHIPQFERRGISGIRRCPKCKDVIGVDDIVVLDSILFRRTDVAYRFRHQPLVFSDRLAQIIKDSGFTGITFGKSYIKSKGELQDKGQLACISSIMPLRLEDGNIAKPLCSCGRIMSPDYHSFKPLVFSSEGLDQTKDFNLTKEPSAGRITIIRKGVRDKLIREKIKGFLFIPVEVQKQIDKSIE